MLVTNLIQRRKLISSMLGSFFFAVLRQPALAVTNRAASYPDHPVRFIVPFTAGSIGDLFMRPLLAQMSESLEQPFVVDNKPGASQAIGADAAAKSIADGYTLCMATQSGLILNSLAKKHLPFDPMNDLAPITLLFTSPMFLYVSSNLNVKTPMDLVALAKNKPGQLNFGSIGPGTAHHLCGELFKSMAGVDIAHIPYKGGPEVTNALISGQVDMMFNGGNTFSYLKTGKVRAIASTGLKRSVSMPQLPTLHECGFVGFDILPWFGVFAPSSLSRELIEKLNFEFVSRLKIMQTQDKFLGQGIEIAPSSPEYLSALMKSDMVNQAKLMRKAGITPE